MGADADSKFRRVLETAGLYCTCARLAVLKVLSRAAAPLNHERIAEELVGKRFDRVTIYRALEAFAKAGLVHKAFLHKRTSYFELADKCTEHQCHPHFTCTDCGRTHCLPEVSIPMARSPRNGFVIHRQQVQLEGLCPQCSAGA